VFQAYIFDLLFQRGYIIINDGLDIFVRRWATGKCMSVKQSMDGIYIGTKVSDLQYVCHGVGVIIYEIIRECCD